MGILHTGTRNSGCSQRYAVYRISARLLQQCRFSAPFIYVSLCSFDHLTLDSLSAVSFCEWVSKTAQFPAVDLIINLRKKRLALLQLISDALFGFEPLCAWAEMLLELQLHANMQPVISVWLWFQFSPVGCVRWYKVISARTSANAKHLSHSHLCCCCLISSAAAFPRAGGVWDILVFLCKVLQPVSHICSTSP